MYRIAIATVILLSALISGCCYHDPNLATGYDPKTTYAINPLEYYPEFNPDYASEPREIVVNGWVRD